jgi:glycosyltransferase involved in cell wall biosynthesis
VRSNTSPSGWSKNFIKKILYKKILGFADIVIVNSLEFKKEFKTRFNIKALCIYNPLNCKEIQKLAKIKIKNNFFNAHSLNIINVARLADEKDHLTLLKAINLLKNTIKIKLLIIGDGANKANLLKRAESEGLNNIIFLDSVSKDQVVRYWSLLDVSIIHLKKDELFTTVIPSKLFECMGMAIPVLHGVEGESARIVESEDIGLLFEPENTEALVSALRHLADNPQLLARFKANGSSGAQRYDRSVLAAEMLETLNRASGGKREQMIAALGQALVTIQAAEQGNGEEQKNDDQKAG